MSEPRLPSKENEGVTTAGSAFGSGNKATSDIFASHVRMQ